MRFKQRLKVIQSLEDTAKRSVVGDIAAILKNISVSGANVGKALPFFKWKKLK